MTMIKTFAAVNMTSTGALAGLELGETPFQLGGNAKLFFPDPIGGAGVITLEGSPDGATSPSTYTTIRTLNAAQTASQWVELTDLPAYIRMNVTTVGTGTFTPTLHGVQ